MKSGGENAKCGAATNHQGNLEKPVWIGRARTDCTAMRSDPPIEGPQETSFLLPGILGACTRDPESTSRKMVKAAHRQIATRKTFHFSDATNVPAHRPKS